MWRRKRYNFDFGASKTLIAKGIDSIRPANEETEIRSLGYIGYMKKIRIITLLVGHCPCTRTTISNTVHHSVRLALA